jgi:murein DD-endopeptidase MepM/ murein hydrolase activator NlpD
MEGRWWRRPSARARALRSLSGSRFWLVALVVFVLSVFVSKAIFHSGSGFEDAAVYADLATASELAVPDEDLVQVASGPALDEAAVEVDADAAGPTLNVTTGHIASGGTVAQALAGQGVPPALIHDISRAMRGVFDFRRAHAGDFYALIRDENGGILSFEFYRGRRTIYRIEAEGDRLVASESQVPLELRVVRLGGVIQRSLSESMRALGERSDLVQAFADIFVWDLDFSTQTRPGDEFRLVFEKYYDREGFVGYGRVLAAEYRTAYREFVTVYFEDDEGYGDYFTPEGNSVRRTFLRAPVDYTRISSRYTKSRLHPVLKVRRAHEAVDYAAPSGTPVWAVADGEVVHVGRNGGLGRLVKIRHSNGYTSYYGHLSGYAKGLAVGRRVRQKEVIGYVGQSGLATGPHLDYRLHKGGRYLDPLKVRFPKGDPIPVKSRGRFNQTKELRLAELREAAPPLVLDAAM